jgi:PH (Pleckstrin Homology) domain-containing protein
MARYASPWDRSLKLTTGLLGVVFLGVTAFALTLVQDGRPGGGDPRLLLLGPVVFLLVGAISWSLSPRGFTVEAGVVRVERPLRPVEIPLREVREVNVLPEGGMRGVLKTFGSSGAFGHVGWFWSRRLGAFRMYATRSKRLVRLVAGKRTFVLSPEPLDRFVEEVLARSPAARGGSPT